MKIKNKMKLTKSLKNKEIKGNNENKKSDNNNEGNVKKDN